MNPTDIFNAISIGFIIVVFIIAMIIHGRP